MRMSVTLSFFLLSDQRAFLLSFVPSPAADASAHGSLPAKPPHPSGHGKLRSSLSASPSHDPDQAAAIDDPPVHPRGYADPAVQTSRCSREQSPAACPPPPHDPPVSAGPERCAGPRSPPLSMIQVSG